MKKIITKVEEGKQTSQGPMTIGIDLGDRTSCYCRLNGAGEVEQKGRFATTKPGVMGFFGGQPRCRVALEVGTHSAWVSRLLKGLGFEVIVANARQVKLISQSSRKDDPVDAETLARLARLDPELLRPIEHRSEKAQADLLGIRVRAALVEARTALVNTARGLTKSLGERLPSCDADQMGVGQTQALSEALQQGLQPLLQSWSC